MMKRKAVITGLGIVAPNGIGVEAYWDALINGKSGITRISAFDASTYRSQIGGEVSDKDLKEYLDTKTARRAARHSKMAIVSATLAAKDAGLTEELLSSERMGVCFGTTIGSPNEIYAEQHGRFLKKGRDGVLPTCSSEYTTHAITSQVCIALGVNGPNTTVAAGCSSGLDVIDWAAEMVWNNRLDMAVVGASDALLSEFSFATLDSLGILSTRNNEPEKASRPFERDRDGSVASEGAGAVIVESLEHARKRGARIYCEILSHASSNEAENMIYTDKEGKSIVSAIRRAMSLANLRPDTIDHISAHGVGIKSMDLAETNAFKTYFREQAYRIPVSSVKSMTGQSYAAGGSFQTVAVCKAIETGIIPPTINYDEPDPECDLDYVPNISRYNKIKYAMINSQSAGGSQSILILGHINGGQ